MVRILKQLATLALAGAAFVALAQPPADGPAGPSQQGQAPQSPPAPPDDEDGSAPSAEDDDVFIPTEEIPADEEITFPVNI